MSPKAVGLIDYGAGNLHSVFKALQYLGENVRLIQKPDDAASVDRLILPGVGAFGAAMDQLRRSGLDSLIQHWIQHHRPFLGICLGMQLLMESSEESPDVPGLGIIPGTCRKFRAPRVPQIGWNHVEPTRPHPLFEGLPTPCAFYFLHGYYIDPLDHAIVLGETVYHQTRYPAIIHDPPITATQFHPEKSGPAGLKLLKNWCRLSTPEPVTHSD